MIINELVTKLSFKQDNGLAAYERSMQAAKRSTERAAAGMERSMRGANKTINNLLKFNVQVKTDKAHMQVKSLEKAISGLGKIAGAGIGVGAIGVAGAGMIGKEVLDNAKTMESLRAGLVTATGSEAKARKEFERLSGFASKFPSTIDEVIKSYIQLQNLGLDSSERAMTAYGNLAGATPGKKIGDVTAMIADASTFQFERLREFGMSYEQNDNTVDFTFKGIKTTVKKNAADIQKFLIATIEKNFGGGMERQSKTIEGKLSNLSDSWIIAMDKIWESSLKAPVHTVVEKMTAAIKDLTPKAIKFAKDAEKLAINILPKIKPIVEGITAALIGMGGAYAYFKVIAVLDFMTKLVFAWRAMDGAMKAAAISGAIANATIAFIPMLIAAAVAAVAWFGWQVYKYITQGTDSLTWMNENFKWVADSIMFVGELIKTWWPIIEYTAKIVAGVLMLAFQGLWEIIKFGWETIVKPKFDAFVQSLTDIWNWVKSVTVENENWNAGITILWDNFKGFLNWLTPVLQWVEEKVGGIGNAARDFANTLASVPGFGGGSETQPTVSGGALDASGLGFNQSMAAKMVQSIRTVQTASGRCLNAVWQGQQRALGGKSPITAYHAADSAAQLSKSAMFREITGVTPQMLKDPKFMKMLHGATVIYNRNAGFSKVSGHAEIWDMVTKTAQFGRGNVALNRNAHQLKNARIFIPVTSGGGQGAVNINSLVINVPNTNATPAQIKKSVTDGTSKALNKANQQNRQAAPAGAR